MTVKFHAMYEQFLLIYVVIVFHCLIKTVFTVQWLYNYDTMVHNKIIIWWENDDALKKC